MDPLVCRWCMGVWGSLQKNDVTKVYSALALSMRTSNNDRTRASIGSFCYYEYLAGSTPTIVWYQHTTCPPLYALGQHWDH